MKTKSNYFISESKMISDQELKGLFKSIRPHMELALREEKNFHYVTDYYLFYLGSLTGCRVSEIISIKLGDIGQNTLQVLGKGRKLRSIPLGKKGRAALEELIKIKKEVLNHKTSSDDFLFLNRNGKPLSRHSVAARFRFWKPRIGIKRDVNFHGLRHRFATHLLNNGFNVAEVSRIMGHSSIQITSCYLHMTIETQNKVDSVL